MAPPAEIEVSYCKFRGAATEAVPLSKESLRNTGLFRQEYPCVLWARIGRMLNRIHKASWQIIPYSKSIAIEVAKNAAMSSQLIRSRRLRKARAGEFFSGTDAQLERYAFQSLRMLQDEADGVEGRTVLEIGPGDFLTSGLALLAGGASSYTSLDRFVGDPSSSEGKRWYLAIQQNWSRFFPQLKWPDWLDAEGFPENYPERIHLIREGVEDFIPTEKFDVVCSFQVAEHVRSIDSFASFNASSLSSTGVAVHRVDFGPHGLLMQSDNPFAFLIVPNWLWRLMVSSRGLPNRYRVNELEEAFERVGLTGEVTRSDVLNVTDEMMESLPPRLQGFSHDSIGTQTALFILRSA